MENYEQYQKENAPHSLHADQMFEPDNYMELGMSADSQIADTLDALQSLVHAQVKEQHKRQAFRALRHLLMERIAEWP